MRFQMGKLSVKCANPELNKPLCEKIIEIISSIPGGKTLINDALKNGDITLDLQAKTTCWKAYERIISINLTESPTTILLHISNPSAHSNTLKMIKDIEFEMCNAANPYAHTSDFTLKFESPQALGIESETKEWYSILRHEEIRSAAMDKGIFPRKSYIPTSRDLSEHIHFMINHEDPGYGPSKTHFNLYMNIYKEAYDQVTRMIRSIEAVVHRLNQQIGKMLTDSDNTIVTNCEKILNIRPITGIVPNSNAQRYDNIIKHIVLLINWLKATKESIHNKLLKQLGFDDLEKLLIQEKEIFATMQEYNEGKVIDADKINEMISELKSQIKMTPHITYPILSLDKPDPLTYGYKRVVEDIRVFTDHADEHAQKQWNEFGYSAPETLRFW